MIEVLLHRLDPELPLPRYAHPGDAGADVYARNALTLMPGERALMPTGIAIALQPGFVAFVHPRSGLASKAGITIVNAPGTVDAGYRGEIMVNLINLDPRETAHIARGDRIAQLIVQRYEHAEFVEVSALPQTHRGGEGFGSTG